MMKKITLVLSVVMVICVCVAAFSLSAAPAEKVTELNTKPAKVELLTGGASAPDNQKVLEARFLNMLNHSFVYDSDFDTVEDIVNSSVAALLDMRTEDEMFINENVVADYVYNMYGVEIEDFSDINADFPKLDGYVFVLPRGYSLYNHEMVSSVVNEDGSFTVTTSVRISTHDNGEYIESCTTLFVANPDSQFGYNIIYSNIGGISAEI